MSRFEVAVGVLVFVLFVLVGTLFASPLICTAQTTISTALIQGIPAGIIALIVAGIGSAIAYNQYKVARAKLNLDLFTRRMVIFNKTFDIIKLGTGQNVPDDAFAREFLNLIPEAQFLYGQEVNQYMNEVVQHSFSLSALLMFYEKSGKQIGSEEWKALVEGQRWFVHQMPKCTKLFAPYLDFTKWR